MSRPTVCVLVLGYRSRSWLERGTIESILRSAENVAGWSAPVVFLDNDSRDGSCEWLAREAPQIDVLLAPRNELYCGGVNAQLQYAARRFDPELYLIVDADNYANETAYRELVRFAGEHPHHGVVQPLVRSRSDPDKLYSCGHVYTEDHWCLPRTRLPRDEAELLDQPSVSLSSTLIRADLLRAIGLLDPIYEIYYESSDLGFRARAAGWYCGCHSEALTSNEGTAGVGPESMHQRYYFNRNRLLFWRLHDSETFRAVREECRDRLDELERARSASEWGLGPTDEATRRGLVDGLHLAGGLCTPRKPPRLDGWQNGRAVVLQQGSAR